MGDFDRILADVPVDVDDNRLRTVFFEVQSIHDIPAGLQRLNAMGIAPSRLIVANHGDIGVMPIFPKPAIHEIVGFQDSVGIHTRAYANYANTSFAPEANFRGYALGSMRHSIASMVNNYMQPSRSIDDPKAMIGAKVILFVSCFTAAVGNPKNMGGNKVALLPETSFLSEVAQLLARSRLDSPAVLYGAESRCQTEPTLRGLRFTELSARTDQWIPCEAVRLDVCDGRITCSQAAEVQLRNFDKPMPYLFEW